MTGSQSASGLRRRFARTQPAPRFGWSNAGRGRDGRAEETLACEQVPCDEVTESNDTPVGRVSFTCTEVALDGPALAAVSVSARRSLCFSMSRNESNPVLIGVVVWGVLRLSSSGAPAASPVGPIDPGGPRPHDRALEELRVRYARGELERDDFLERRADLGGPPAPDASLPGEPPAQDQG